MSEILHDVKMMYDLYNGTGAHLALFLGCLFLLIFCKTKSNRKIAVFWAGYSIVLLVIFICPLTAKIIMDYCVGPEVYWRMLWIFPIGIVLAYVGTEIIARQKHIVMKVMALLAAVAIIVVTGSNIMTGMKLADSWNNTKLKPEVLSVCEALEEDAQQRDEEEITVIVPNELLCYIRQYDAAIKMPYGRDALRGNCWNPICDVMQQAEPDCALLAQLAREYGCNYLVYHAFNDNVRMNLEAEGYEAVRTADQYIIYYLEI